MKRIFYCLLFCPLWSIGQQVPVQWSVDARPAGEGQWLLSFSVQVQPGWHVYGQRDSVYGLAPLQIRIKGSNELKEDTVVPILPLLFREDPLFDQTMQAVYSPFLQWDQLVHVEDDGERMHIVLQGQASNDEEFVPVQLEKDIMLGKGILNHSFWMVFLLGIAGGLLALLTPLGMGIFSALGAYGKERERERGKSDMMRETGRRKQMGVEIEKREESQGGYYVSTVPGRKLGMLRVVNGPEEYFLERERERKRERVRKKKIVQLGRLYGGMILVVCMVVVICSQVVDGLADGLLHSMISNAWVNVIIGLLFLFFAVSFLGLIPLTVFRGKSKDKVGSGKMAGGFAMALCISLLSILCTISILGSLPSGGLSYSTGATQLTAGMSGSAVAMVIPFVLLTFFPDWLNYFPKTGNNLEVVKTSLGFVQLAMALLFLWNADQSLQWGILNREWCLGIMLSICLGFGVYMLGVIDQLRCWGRKRILQRWKVLMVVKNDPEILPFWRRVVGAVVLLMAVYLGWELVGW
jgi:hypothetical protein